MPTPSLDIVLPVWNSPAETRVCLVSLLPSIAAGARLILINNGCDRETERLLEDFSDPLGNQIIYMTMGRNIGFIPALNHGLGRSDADWALMLRSSTALQGNCREWLESGAANEQAGILTPFFQTLHHPEPKLNNRQLGSLETSDISFDLVALSRRMREKIGLFDENLDSGAWCLKDYRQRARSFGFLTCLVTGLPLITGPTTIFGSEERRRRQEELSADLYAGRWGIQHHAALYLPQDTTPDHLSGICAAVLEAARLGHSFDLFLHRPQYRDATEQGLLCRHAAIRYHKLPLLAPLRSLARQMADLKALHPGLLVVKGVDGIPFPGYDEALPPTTIADMGSRAKED